MALMSMRWAMTVPASLSTAMGRTITEAGVAVRAAMIARPGRAAAPTTGTTMTPRAFLAMGTGAGVRPRWRTTARAWTMTGPRRLTAPSALEAGRTMAAEVGRAAVTVSRSGMTAGPGHLFVAVEAFTLAVMSVVTVMSAVAEMSGTATECRTMMLGPGRTAATRAAVFAVMAVATFTVLAEASMSVVAMSLLAVKTAALSPGGTATVLGPLSVLTPLPVLALMSVTVTHRRGAAVTEPGLGTEARATSSRTTGSRTAAPVLFAALALGPRRRALLVAGLALGAFLHPRKTFGLGRTFLFTGWRRALRLILGAFALRIAAHEGRTEASRTAGTTGTETRTVRAKSFAGAAARTARTAARSEGTGAFVFLFPLFGGRLLLLFIVVVAPGAVVTAVVAIPAGEAVKARSTSLGQLFRPGIVAGLSGLGRTQRIRPEHGKQACAQPCSEHLFAPRVITSDLLPRERLARGFAFAFHQDFGYCVSHGNLPVTAARIHRNRKSCLLATLGSMRI